MDGGEAALQRADCMVGTINRRGVHMEVVCVEGGNHTYVLKNET